MVLCCSAIRLTSARRLQIESAHCRFEAIDNTEGKRTNKVRNVDANISDNYGDFCSNIEEIWYLCLNLGNGYVGDRREEEGREAEEDRNCRGPISERHWTEWDPGTSAWALEHGASGGPCRLWWCPPSLPVPHVPAVSSIRWAETKSNRTRTWASYWMGVVINHMRLNLQYT